MTNPTSPPAPEPPPPRGRPLFGIQPLKWVFALEYVMQGLANPFQGITYQPFFRHFKVDYRLSEIPGQAKDELSVQMLILGNSVAFVASFACVHLLPDRRETLATGETEEAHVGPERWNVLGSKVLRAVDAAAVAAGVGLLLLATLSWELDVISAVLLSFFGITMLRKWTLDGVCLAKHSGRVRP